MTRSLFNRPIRTMSLLISLLITSKSYLFFRTERSLTLLQTLKFHPPKQRMMMSSQVSDFSKPSLSSQPPITATNSPPSINLKSLKSEVTRQYLRSIKKFGKVSERVQRQTSSGSKEPSEESKDIEKTDQTLLNEYEDLKNRVDKLKRLEESLSGVKSIDDSIFLSILPVIRELNLTDAPRSIPERGPKKEKVKGPPPAPRKPYNVYESKDGITIYVGRRAEDNDELSCNPEHRAPDEWWLHVSGYAGSHVVIKCNEEALPTLYRETVLDAAVLAAVNSKAANCGRVTVSLTRCRNVSKPKGVPAGLVHLSGDIRSVTFDLRVESKRLERLQKLG